MIHHLSIIKLMKKFKLSITIIQLIINDKTKWYEFFNNLKEKSKIKEHNPKALIGEINLAINKA